MSNLSSYLKELSRRAEQARSSPATLGPDIDLDTFLRKPAEGGREEGSEWSGFGETALQAGVDLSGGGRSGTYLQVDNSTLCSRVQEACRGAVEIRPVGEAFEKVPHVEDYWWRTIAVDSDKYTSYAALHSGGGYFIRISEGEHVERPVQACMIMEESGIVQNVHNVVIAGDNSKSHIVAGCAVQPQSTDGIHIGISEFYVGRGATLTFTMIHNWSEGFHVRPRSAAVVEEGGVFISNYILLQPVRSLQMYPVTILKGDRSRARFQSVLCGRGDSLIDVGSRTLLQGEYSRAEAISRAIGADSSRMIARGKLVARTDHCRGHLECLGMLASSEARIEAVPELVADGVPQAELSHEAAISPIAEEQVSYLMSRGLAREEAVASITRGFLNIDLPELPQAVQRSLEEVLSLTPADEHGP